MSELFDCLEMFSAREFGEFVALTFVLSAVIICLALSFVWAIELIGTAVRRLVESARELIGVLKGKWGGHY